MNRNMKRSAVVGGTIAALLGTTVALAAWTNYGESTGTVTAGTTTPLTVTVTNVGGLYPTKSVNVPFTVRNTNPYDVKLTKVELKSVVVTSAPGPTCDPSVVTGSTMTLNTASDVVATNTTSGSYNFPVTMSNTATDDCQNAVFTVKLGVTGLSN
jgi:hypothetical protein